MVSRGGRFPFLDDIPHGLVVVFGNILIVNPNNRFNILCRLMIQSLWLIILWEKGTKYDLRSQLESKGYDFSLSSSIFVSKINDFRQI